MLTQEERKYLLNIAKQSIELAVNEKDPQIPNECPEVFRMPSGAFVTIHKFGELRGCIGYIEATRPLIDTIVEAASHAAMNDPRFMPVSIDELEDLELEISILSPLKEITDVNEIEVGTHGIMMEQGSNRGLLLPQVPAEYNWDRDTFLSQTARKAGLPYDAWKKGNTKISIFTAEIFNESNI